MNPSFRRVSVAAAVTGLLAVAGLGGGSNRQLPRTRMPLTLAGSTGSFYPVWVDHRAALNPDETINRIALHPSYARAVEDVLATPPENGCVDPPRMYASRVDLQPRGSLREAVETAQLVLLSRVTGRSFGFYGGEAGQLLRLSPEKVFKGRAGRAVYYTFMPIGDFLLGGTSVCKKDSRYARPPDLGAEVLTFTHPAADDIVDPNDPGDLITIDSSGKVSLPENYSRVHPDPIAHPAVPVDRAALLQEVGALVAAARAAP